MTKHQVYVAAPLGARTGGPEALHQLVDALRLQRVDAVLWPIGRSRFVEPVKEYDVYDAPIARDWPTRGAVTVVPEVSPRELHLTLGAASWLWWLSVDNSPHPSTRRLHLATQTATNGHARDGRRSSWLSMLRETANGRLAQWGARRSGFLFQSEYARDFCGQYFERDGHTVTDYLRRVPYSTWQPPAQVSVAYNPAKSEGLIAELRESLPDLHFRALAGLSYEAVLEILANSTLYLEAGHLPGRDRLPREAARVGCPVLMLARGAGKHQSDFPLPSSYRIPYDESWLDRVREAVLRMVSDPMTAAISQQDIQVWVRSDRERFFQEVQTWWVGSDGGRRK